MKKVNVDLTAVSTNEVINGIRKNQYDIRDWAPEHEKMGKGVTLTHDEAEKLSALLKDNL